MKRLIVVANRTGGQGKTLLAHLIFAFSGSHRVALCADSVEAGGVSKLGRMIDGVVEIGSGPSGAAVQESALEAYRYWDVIGETLFDASEGPVIVDVGANVIDRILEWGVVTGFADVFGDTIDPVLVVPVVARPKSLSDAVEVVREALSRDGGIGFREVVVVRNAWQGSFASVQDLPEYRDLQKVLEGCGRFVDLSRCDSSILSAVEEKHLFFGDISEMNFRDLAGLFGWDRMKAARDAKLFRLWYDQARESLQRAGVFGPAEVVGGSDGRGLPDSVPS